MTIFAQKAFTLGNSGGQLSVQLPQYIPDGSVLQWSSEQQAFVANSPAQAGALTGAINLGGPNVYGPYAGQSGTILQFKQFIAGAGISLSQDYDSITVTANVATDQLSVSGNYSITINNQAIDPSAQFQLLTAFAAGGSPITATPSNLPPLPIPNVYTLIDPNTMNGAFQTINGVDFYASGFRIGMWISVTGTQSQNGQWQIQAINLTTVGSNTYSTMVLTVPFTGSSAYNLGGPIPLAVFQQADIYIPPATSSITDISPDYNPSLLYQLSSYSLDFGPLGLNLQPGMILQLTGTQANLPFGVPSNDGNYTIQQIIAKPSNPLDYSIVIFTPACPLPGAYGMQLEANALSPNITITIQNYVGPTGFYVTTAGNIFGSNLTLTGTSGLVLSNGTTAQRPSSPSSGTIRYNISIASLEVYSAGNWYVIEMNDNGGIVVTDGTNTVNNAGSIQFIGAVVSGTSPDAVVLVNYTLIMVTSGTEIMAGLNQVIALNKTIGSPTTVNLLASPAAGNWLRVKDSKGDASTNNITLLPASGTIDGQSQFVMTANYQDVLIIYDGEQWGVYS